MKKMTLIFLSAMMVFGLTACGNTNEDNGDGKTAEVTVTATPEEIEQKIAAAIGEDNYLCDTDIDEDWLENSYGLDLSKVESYVAKQNSISSVNLDTVIILKTEDGYADEAVDKLNENFAQTVDYSKMYSMNVAKVSNARIYKAGNYVMYLLAGAGYDGEDAEEESKLALAEYEKIDEAVREIFGVVPKNLAAVPQDEGAGD